MPTDRDRWIKTKHIQMPGESYPPPGPWKEFAACKGQDPNLFHPRENSEEQTRDALKFCSVCAVQELCLEYAMVYRVPGIYGGTTKRERDRRRKVLRERKAG